VNLHKSKWQALRDQQQQCPSGILGRLVGEQMRRQHGPETNWTINLLTLQPSDRILELGFGAGQGLALALPQISNGHATGADLSATMVRAATGRNRSALRKGHLSLVQADIQCLPFPPLSFDKIFSIHTYYFFPKPDAMIDRLVDLLIVGGRLVLTLATAHTMPGGEKKYWELHKQVTRAVEERQQNPDVSARLVCGPDSRRYNNMAIVIDKVRE
jgi:ubiquinone/menaquinone biosynthesis C-methylase UbiE